MSRVVAVAVVIFTAAVGIVLSDGPTARSAQPKTLKFTSITKASTFHGDRFVDSSVDKAHGKVIGYDVTTGTYDKQTQRVSLDIAAALGDGMLYVSASFQGDAKKITGQVTGGTGAYKGAAGTIKVLMKSDKKSVVTVSLA